MERRDLAIWALSAIIIGSAVTLKIEKSDSQNHTEGSMIAISADPNLISGLASVCPNVRAATAYQGIELSNQFLSEVFKNLEISEPKNGLIIASSPPENSFNQDNLEPVDFYFKFVERDENACINNQVETYLVIDPEYLNDHQITYEELAIIIAQKTLVFQGLVTIISSELSQDTSVNQLRDRLNSESARVVRRNLETIHWFAVANLTIGPLDDEGKLKSDRLRALRPAVLLTRRELLSGGLSKLNEWIDNLPPTDLPGLYR